MERIGIVEALFVSPQQGNLDNPTQMEAQEKVVVIPDGIEGDRYATGTGFWQGVDSKKTPGKRKQRAISIISADDIEDGNRENGTNINPVDTRRNIVIRGVKNLQQYIGRDLHIGEVVLYVSDDCDACNRPSKIARKDGFEKFGRKGGVRAVPVKTGPINKNAEVFVE